MDGFFDANGNQKVTLEIRGKAQDSSKKITALFDTGHNGTLSLPIIDLIEIGATLRGYGEMQYANGYTGVVYYFSVTVIIDGTAKEVQATMIENPAETEAIAGLELFAPYVSVIDFKNKRMNFIEAEKLKAMIDKTKQVNLTTPLLPMAQKISVFHPTFLIFEEAYA